MKTEKAIPLNTLDEALLLAHTLLRDVARRDTKAAQGYRIFSALASDESEGLAAFLIWRARGETIHALTRGE